MVLHLTVFWHSGAVLGHVRLGLGMLAWGPFLFPPMVHWRVRRQGLFLGMCTI